VGDHLGTEDIVSKYSGLRVIVSSGGKGLRVKLHWRVESTFQSTVIFGIKHLARGN
jgi:hypothetical protein